MMRRGCILLAAALMSGAVSLGQAPGVNYDEAQVPSYTLPDPLVLENGQAVHDAETWIRQRRPEVLGLFEEHVYGRRPGRPAGMRFEVTSVDGQALGGMATRKEVTVYFTGRADGPSMDVLLYLPNAAPGPVPAFLGLNFYGNHTINHDPAIKMSERWMRRQGAGVVDNRATEASRGSAAGRWPLETILARGYAVATVYCGDLEPDHADGWRDGIRGVFRADGTLRDQAAGGDEAAGPGGHPQAAPDAWGCIAAWSWGLSRALDYLETVDAIDATQVAVLGHSRLGKTALWAGAMDERFAITISNNSGCGGAALSRRRFGETVERINTSFPHWFSRTFRQYNGNEDALPVDQHMLIALMAPRPVYVASAEDDRWADPRGEFLSARHAEPVYALFGRPGLGVNEQPAVNRPVGETIGYHVRVGGHAVTAYDWEQYLRFADRHFGR